MRGLTLKAALPLLLVLIAAGCAPEKQSDEGSGETGSISTTQTPPPPANNNNNNNNTTPPPNNNGGGSSNSSCNKPNIFGPVLTKTVNGQGTQSVDAPYNFITGVDSLIKVKITPVSATLSSLVSADVTLLKDGSPISSAVPYPGGGLDQNGYRNGINIGQGVTKDFSSYITSNGNYGIRISNVMTDHKCNTYCTAQQYSTYIYTDYYTCNSWASWGYTWTAYGCYGPDYAMINQCKALQCNVGTPTSNDNWSINIQVETDNTACL